MQSNYGIIIATGLKYMLDVGLYRLDQQVACQRHRQSRISANSIRNKLASAVNGVKAAFMTPQLVLAV